jgi:hypothetical protein
MKTNRSTSLVKIVEAFPQRAFVIGEDRLSAIANAKLEEFTIDVKSLQWR